MVELTIHNGWMSEVDEDISFDEFYSTSTDENDETDYIKKYETDADFREKVFRAISKDILQKHNDWEYVGNVFGD